MPAPAVADERPPVLIAEFPFRISLETLFELTEKVKQHYEEVAGELVLEVNGDRERLQLHHYPDYQEGVP